MILLKKSFFLILLACIFSAQADEDKTGYYLGLQLGYGERHLNDNTFFREAGEKQQIPFAGKLSMGYILSPNFALETGWMYLPDATAKTAAQEKIRWSSYALDLALRLGLPFYQDFLVYGKLGMAYSHTVLHYPAHPNSNAKLFEPVFGLGLAYEKWDPVSFSIEWLRVLGNGNAFDGYAQQQQVTSGGFFTNLPPMDTFLLGAAYRF